MNVNFAAGTSEGWQKEITENPTDRWNNHTKGALEFLLLIGILKKAKIRFPEA